jgi:hypothetical protein
VDAVHVEEGGNGGRRITVTLHRIDNAVFAFYDEKDSVKLGTLAIAIPQVNGRRHVSSTLIGERNTVVTQILAEQLSKGFNTIAVVSTHFSEMEDRTSGRALIDLTQKLIAKASPPTPSC